MTTLILIGIAVLVGFLNLIMYKIKYEKNRIPDLLLDLSVMGFLNWLFAGTLAGMIIATGISFLIGIYLYFSPPKLMQEF